MIDDDVLWAMKEINKIAVPRGTGLWDICIEEILNELCKRIQKDD